MRSSEALCWVSARPPGPHRGPRPGPPPPALLAQSGSGIRWGRPRRNRSLACAAREQCDALPTRHGSSVAGNVVHRGVECCAAVLDRLDVEARPTSGAPRDAGARLMMHAVVAVAVPPADRGSSRVDLTRRSPSRPPSERPSGALCRACCRCHARGAHEPPRTANSLHRFAGSRGHQRCRTEKQSDVGSGTAARPLEERGMAAHAVPSRGTGRLISRRRCRPRGQRGVAGPHHGCIATDHADDVLVMPDHSSPLKGPSVVRRDVTAAAFSLATTAVLEATWRVTGRPST